MTMRNDQVVPQRDDALMEAVFDAAPDGIVIVDGSGRMVLANRRIEEIFGYGTDQLAGQPVEVLVPDEVRTAHTSLRRRYDAHPAARPMGAGLHLEGRRRDGSRLPVEISLSPVTTGAGRFTVAIVRDVSERVRAEAELRAAREEVALLEDRDRIARELHDTVLQRIFATGLMLQAAAARVPAPEVRERIESAVGELDTTIRDIRTAIFTLHGPSNTGSLREALMSVAAEAGRVLGFSPSVRFAGAVEGAVPADVGEALQAVLREGLSNVARHARASRVDVDVSAADRVTLRITDDGVGLPAGAPVHGGRGLANMADRARLLGGSSTVRTRPDGGTLVEWSVPL